MSKAMNYVTKEGLEKMKAELELLESIERQLNVLDETIKDIKSTITNRDMTEEARRKSIDTEVNYMLYKMNLEGQQNVRDWIYEGINAASKLMPYGK